MLDSDRRFRPSPEVLFQGVGGEGVLLDSGTCRFYGLNAVGCEIWNMMVNGVSLEQIAARLAVAYELAPQPMREDALALFDQLLAAGLIEPLAVSACDREAAPLHSVAGHAGCQE